MLAAGILLTVLILGLTGAFHRAPAAPAEVNTASPSESSSAPVASTADSNPEQEGSPDNAVAAGAEPQAPGDISRAIYIVQVETDEDHQRYRLGTAWAISPQKLITSGAVAAGVQALRKVASTARVVSADGMRSLTVRSIRLHPGYESAMEDAGDAQSEAEGLRLELEQRSADVDSLTEQLITAEEKRYQAYERQTGVDLALLEVDGAMPHSLPVAKSSERPLKLGSRMRLAGFPFEEEDFIVDPDHSSSLETRDATVGTAPHGHTAGPAYWRIRTGADLGSDNWSGSPVIDSTGGVVGVYSRPTPPPPGRPPPETWILHDVADAEGLTALGENRP